MSGHRRIGGYCCLDGNRGREARNGMACLLPLPAADGPAAAAGADPPRAN